MSKRLVKKVSEVWVRGSKQESEKASKFERVSEQEGKWVSKSEQEGE